MPKPVFFVHVMKTAGTTLSHTLRRLYREDASYPAGDSQNRLGQKVNVMRLLEHAAAATHPLDFYTVHMPAWLAFHVAPQHLHITLLREPVARTVSHLRQIARGTGAASLEDIYAHPEWRSRLSNYQTRLFSLSHDDHCRQQAAVRADLERLQLSVEELRQLAGSRAMVEYGLLTGMSHADDVDEHSLQAAIAQLDRFALVGITEALPAFGARLAALLGRDLGPMPRKNVTAQPLPVAESLLTQIRQDNALDLQLYEHVKRHCAQAGPEHSCDPTLSSR